MTYYYFIGGIFSAVVLLPVAIVAWRLVSRRARDESAQRAPRLLLITYGALIVGAFAWVPMANTAAESSAASSFERYCSSTNEKILRTVSNVEGLYIDPPAEINGGDYHRGDHRGWSYVKRPERRYKFVEIGDIGQRGGIRRTDDASPSPIDSRIDQPTARYALTWIGLQDIQEANEGIFGEQTLIYDRQTHEILATRTFYYRTEGPLGRKTSLRPCPGVNLSSGVNHMGTGEPDSYAFVSRVLQPAPESEAEVLASYDLARGMGRRESVCAFKINVGPGISQRDILAERRLSELHLSLAGSPDRLVCKTFFPWMLEEDAAVIFPDGTRVAYSSYANLPDVGMTELNATMQRLRALPPSRGATESPRTELPGTRAEKSPTKIYRWVDGSGSVHYTDERDTPAEFRK